MQKLVNASVGLALVLAGGSAFAHTRWKVGSLINPRSEADGLKVGPCGNVPATTDANARAALTAGQQITVEWEETIDHHGYFKINFSPKNDVNWTALSAEIPDAAGQKGFRSTQITVPAQNCSACTLQITQFMDNDNGGGSFYYSCADVKITGGTPEAATSDVTSDTATASDTETSTDSDGAATSSTDSDTATGGSAAAPAVPTGLKVDVKKPKGGK